MKLIREVPKGSRLIASGFSLFGEPIFYFKIGNHKVIQICDNYYDFDVYIGHDCF